jgi:hypothetical protein
MNNRSIGIVAYTNSTIIKCHPKLPLCCILYIATVIVHNLESGIIINGNTNCWYTAKNVCRTTIAMMGFDNGTIIDRKIRIFDAPSILAASKSSAGNPSKKPFIKKIGQAHADHGSTTPHMVFIKFHPVNGNLLIVKYVGISKACSGIIMVPRKNRRISLPPLGRI